MPPVNIIDKLCDALKSEPIQKAWIFGSYARGEQTPDSDIDILVDFEPNNNLNLFSLAALIIRLEKIMGKKVDLVERSRIYPYIADSIENQKILIYERS